MKNHLNVIGLMSGTSLDGLDLALCRFTIEDHQWNFKLLKTACIPYTADWKQRLVKMEQANGLELQHAHVAYGRYLGEKVRDFVQQQTEKIDLVASHGHTIHHVPDQGLTFQLGCGATLAKTCGLPVANDFRTGDVALCGQGAPLVPIGDRLLFADYTHCINLGGFANISYEEQGQRIAYDIGPCNMALNFLANQLEQAYDKDGQTARQGALISSLYKQLNALPYFDQAPPKSLGKEWLVAQVLPLLTNTNASVADLLRTVTEHVAFQLAKALKSHRNPNVLVTGGGARNQFLLERFSTLSNVTITPADPLIIDYKEALIFALLGALRLRGETNVLASVTGSIRDHCSGALHRP